MEPELIDEQIATVVTATDRYPTVDPTVKHYVFGYGSLVNHTSMGTTLPGIEKHRIRVGVLRDYRSSWCVGIENRSHVPRRYRDSEGNLYPNAVVVMGIEPVPGASTAGVTIPVTPEELVLLDGRETNYSRINVTHLVDDAPEGIVWTYLPLPEAVERAADVDAVVSFDYLTIVEEGFTALGELWHDRYREWCGLPKQPLRNLVFEVMETSHTD